MFIIDFSLIQVTFPFPRLIKACMPTGNEELHCNRTDKRPIHNMTSICYIVFILKVFAFRGWLFWCTCLFCFAVSRAIVVDMLFNGFDWDFSLGL
jgi:hypothetical protein